MPGLKHNTCFWDTPQRERYLLPELLTDIGGGHNIVATGFVTVTGVGSKGGMG